MRHRYPVGRLIHVIGLKRATYYDRLKRRQRPDKNSKLKQQIKKSFVESRQTYGYRRIQRCTQKAGFKACPDTILRLMNQLGLHPNMYNKHTSKYQSYKGHIGKIAPNILNQAFDAKIPYAVLHTDVTQVRLSNQKWAYISAVIDEASREVLALKISEHPDKELIRKTLNQLSRTLPKTSVPILHSDQGWQYQIQSYRSKLNKMHIIQSMSRKGNCHDNAPIESWFNLLKRECLYQNDLKDMRTLRRITNKYVKWFNNSRISLIHGGSTPAEYCQNMLAA
ncbi:IS3 family transposase [Lactiplantibacillus herbarum]|uniref:IS3 family transposase n=1 Tax=Lactiplantibacillus herbarum TaxID=1670446 RepID=UPI001364D3B8|nr:IS3 family transposase [Lactiplantibacillus herbarum]